MPICNKCSIFEKKILLAWTAGRSVGHGELFSRDKKLLQGSQTKNDSDDRKPRKGKEAERGKMQQDC